MDRKHFGQLIEVLRHQSAYVRVENKPFTQKEMADQVKITLRHYGRLERGEAVNIEGKLLVRLADSFGLTNRERHEFFYAAGGVSQYAVKEPTEALESLQHKLHGLISQSAFPVFISDVLGNLLMAGKGALPIVGFDCEEFLKLKYRNVLWAPLKIDLSHAFSQADLIKVIIANLRLVRGTSLRYRATEMSKGMFADLQDSPQFRAAWQWVSADRGMDFNQSRVFNQDHPRFGMTLSYYSLGSKIVTPWGDLFVTTFTPYDEATFHKFKALKEEHEDEIVEFDAAWPFSLTPSRKGRL